MTFAFHLTRRKNPPPLDSTNPCGMEWWWPACFMREEFFIWYTSSSASSRSTCIVSLRSQVPVLFEFPPKKMSELLDRQFDSVCLLQLVLNETIQLLNGQKKKATAAQPILCPTVPSLQVMQVMCLAHGQGVAIHCQNAQLATSRPCSDTGHASFALVAFVLQVFHLSSVPTAPTASTHPMARLGVKPSISSPALGSPSPAKKSRWKGGWDWGKLLKIGKKCEKNQQGLGKSMPDPRHFTRGKSRTP